MGSRERTIPVRRGPVACMVLSLWALATGASAQPSEFATCLPLSSPPCSQLGGGGTIFTMCPTDPPTERLFVLYFGPVAWGPLRCVGPITVAVESFSGADTRFPLYVEVVPLQESSDFPGVCSNLPGYLTLIVYGQSYLSAPCGAWDEAGPIDITNVIPIGSLYALRLYFFSNRVGYSPAVGCVSVTAHPIAPASVTSTTWSNLKTLYR